MSRSEAYARGAEDAERGRGALFRSTRARGFVANVDDPLADAWTDEMRRAYVDGFEEFDEEAAQ